MMDVKYSDVAAQYIDRAELLTGVISDAGALIKAATRMLEVELDIKVQKHSKESTEYNTTRVMIKRVAALQADLRALNLMLDQQEDRRLQNTARLVELDKLNKLMKWYPDAKAAISDLAYSAVPCPEEKVDDNPYQEAIEEDFDDE